MLTEVKDQHRHYFKDLLGRIQGEYKDWYYNGVLSCHMYYVDDLRHGEYKRWEPNGVLNKHLYFVDDVLIHDFLKNPISDEEKMMLVLKHGAPLLPRGEGMLKEVKNSERHYFKDSSGRWQGEYKEWYSNGGFRCHCFLKDDRLHGEHKVYDINGDIEVHRYFVDNILIHDFIKSPLSDIEKMVLVLKYGAPLLPLDN